ncbi:MAG TPA: DegT/DnrJ/EryC1/StrS family aminotransferase [Candidatus Baltobacteraceae bacterium]|jgi:dTDP-4-amino-4,6-dideoxygalactose transaminase|nr:DegT/DnrJ/EryC1/StrS family aminotransferase [Candidatus Baltobacteraceae bacterium]
MVTACHPASSRKLPSDQDASGRTLGSEELAAVFAAIRSGTLTSTKGTFVRELETQFAAMLGAKHAFACSSGTAAIHCAVAALDPNPGDEIVTSPITDMGAIAPILYQGAVPVFADVDPLSCNVTAASVAERISDRTRAIVATHLFGNPCEIAEIVALGERAGIPVIEDCAQAFLAKYDGRFVGTIGKIGCFSLQQGKHITTGEGGLVVTDDSDLARRINLFINKAWGYGDTDPDHYFLALNYRMSELCGSVARAQLNKLPGIVERRRRLAKVLSRRLRGSESLLTPVVLPGAEHSFWKYCVRMAPGVSADAVFDVARLLRDRGIASAPRYIQKPAFMCEVFLRRKTFGSSGYPLSLARPDALDYSPERYPGTFNALKRILVVPWNDRYEIDDVEYIADALVQAAESLTFEEVAS